MWDDKMQALAWDYIQSEPIGRRLPHEWLGWMIEQRDPKTREEVFALFAATAALFEHDAPKEEDLSPYLINPESVFAQVIMYMAIEAHDTAVLRAGWWVRENFGEEKQDELCDQMHSAPPDWLRETI